MRGGVWGLMSTSAPSVLHRIRRPPSWVAWLIAGFVAASAIGVVVDRTVRSPPAAVCGPAADPRWAGDRSRPDAPGVTAYVAGPHGTWLGSAGVANVQTGEPMRPDARMRLDSVSKWWATAVVLQLAQEGKLRLGSLRSSAGARACCPTAGSIGQLMTDSSGLIDDNDVFRSPDACLARVKDARLRRS